MKKHLYATVAAAAFLALTLSCSNKPKGNAAQTQNEAAAAQADTMPDVMVKDFSRDDVSLLAEVKKHKLTLIDFWASWCGPCMHEMPNVVRLYADFKDKGLGVIGVSLDSDFSAWRKAVDKNKMEWLQLSELRGWNSDVVAVYDFNSIPHTMLVDGSGRIVATGLRGEELHEFVASHLN